MGEAKTIKINGKDCTDLFTPVGYGVQYKKIMGNNSGYMLDGSYTEDVLARKAVVVLSCMPLQEADLSALLSNIYQDDYVTVYFFDPQKQAYRTMEAVAGETEAKFRGAGGTGLLFWTGMIVTLTEV